MRREHRLPSAARRQALRYALLHWRFFDRFVTAETNWLAPDNFQEEPEPVVAMRTSPTNIGLQLLATVSAWDLGFIPLDDLVRRLELAFRSLERMRRFRGHFFNWYDLRDLSVLEPAYVSTVDSGNLAGHLVALRQACLALADEPVLDARVWRALETALALADERLASRPEAGRPSSTSAPRGRAAGIADASRCPGAALAAGDRAAPASRVRAGEARRARAGRTRRSEWIAWSLRLATAPPRTGSAACPGSRPARLRELAGQSAAAARLVDPAARRSPSGPTPTPWRWTSAF